MTDMFTTGEDVAQAAPQGMAGTAGKTASWLAVRAGGYALLIPLSHAGEVGVVGDIQALPYVKHWFMGVINARGLLSNVIDLAAFLDQRATEGRPESALSRCQLIRFNPLLQLHSALLVDEIVGMRSIHGFVSAERRQPGEPAYLGAVYIDSGGSRWREVNLQALAADPLFLDIQA